MPLVSIVLPTHNRAVLLPSAVESVRAQTLQDWELIIVDDGSSDATPEIIRHFERLDPRIKGVRNDPNVRLPRALNRGFSQAGGEFLTWTSDDNLYEPLALETMVKALQDSRAGLVFASMQIVDDDLNPIREWNARPVEEQSVVPWCGACFLYRCEVMRRVGLYDPECFLAEDLDYWIRVRLGFEMVGLPDVLYRYREHAVSLSATRAAEVRQQSAQVVERHLPNITWLSKRLRGETALGLAEAALLRGDVPTLRRWLRTALRGCPDLVLKHFKRGVVAAITGRCG